jgi:hypothetical protein
MEEKQKSNEVDYLLVSKINLNKFPIISRPRRNHELRNARKMAKKMMQICLPISQ